MIAGVATSARGVLEPASTTRRVRAGGDQNIMPVLGNSPSPGVVSTVDPAQEAVRAAVVARGAQNRAAAQAATPAFVSGYSQRTNRGGRINV